LKLLLKLQYDGSRYCGFQVQKNGESIQGVLCRTAEDLFTFPVNVTGCSRTDAGVHALGFCAAVEPKEMERRGEDWTAIPPGRLHRALNQRLPDDIAVIGVAAVPDGFHPRYDVVEKEYLYRIWDRPCRSPFLKGRALDLKRTVSPSEEELMRRTAALYVGRRDFSGFMASGSKITDPVRSVSHAEVFRDAEECLCFSVRADGFLYNMVRIMVGTLLDRVRGAISEEDVIAALDTADRSRAGFTAPPEGLYLKEVFYDREIPFACE